MRSIKGYEGRYSVTEDGYIYSHRSEKILKGRPLPSGYLRVNLVDTNGKAKDFLVHRLVCQTFKPDGHGCVNHIDCNKQNNHPNNLEWCDHTANMAHASSHGRLKSQSEHMTSLNKTRCSVPIVSVDANGQEEWFASMSDADASGFSHAKISLCCMGKRKTHKGRTWRYA